MVTAANATQTDAQQVLNSTVKLTDSGQVDLEANKTYYGNFSKVLANTRTQGADTSAIYDFFAQPILTDNTTPLRKAILNNDDFDFHMILVFLMGLFIGMLSLLVWHRVLSKKLLHK